MRAVNQKTAVLLILVLVAAFVAATNVPAVAGVDTTVDGRVELPEGLAVPGATVVLEALDSVDREVGEVYDPHIIETTTTDEEGQFAIELPPSDKHLRMAGENDGRLNLEVTAAAPVSVINQLYGDTAGPTVGTGLSEGSEVWTTAATFSATRTASAGMGTVLEAGNPLQLILSPVLAADAEALPGALLSTADPDSCSRVRVIDESNEYITVGEMHAYHDVTTTLEYGQTADSDLGVGYSSDGSNWEVSGTVHMGNSRSSDVGLRRSAPYGRHIRTNFHYHKERVRRNCSGFDYYYYRIRSIGWNGGVSEGWDVSNWDGPGALDRACDGCAQPYPANSYHATKRQQGFTYIGSAQAFGVTLSAKSGFSENVRVEWEFGSHNHNHWLIGNDCAPTCASIIYSR